MGVHCTYSTYILSADRKYNRCQAQLLQGKNKQVYNCTFPTAEEPVKERAATSGCSQRCFPMVGVVVSEDGKTLISPAGNPASWASWANASADKGVSGDGLITQGQPAASAAPILRVIIALGKFHWRGKRETKTMLHVLFPLNKQCLHECNITLSKARFNLPAAYLPIVEQPLMLYKSFIFFQYVQIQTGSTFNLPYDNALCLLCICIHIHVLNFVKLFAPFARCTVCMSRYAHSLFSQSLSSSTPMVN